MEKGCILVVQWEGGGHLYSLVSCGGWWVDNILCHLLERGGKLYFLASLGNRWELYSLVSSG